MQEALVFVNVVFCVAALYHNARRIQRSNPRRPLRLVAMFLSGYVLLVYLAVLFNLIPAASVGYYLRWFYIVIMTYLIVEAQNG